MTGENPGDDIRRTLRRLVVATIALWIVLVGVATVSYIQVHGAQTSLCALRDDLEQRVRSGEEFLATHPNGWQGISSAQIKITLDSQRRTVKALSSLPC